MNFARAGRFKSKSLQNATRVATYFVPVESVSLMVYGA